MAWQLSCAHRCASEAPEFPCCRRHGDQPLPVKVSERDRFVRTFSGRVAARQPKQSRRRGWSTGSLVAVNAVSPLVDISNYVMFELGRPSHTFDLENSSGRRPMGQG
jgi:phenylalanyl-tRNA synthetase beta chain